MHDHGDFILSPAGLNAEGEIDYCSGGGCQYRAFSNALLLNKSIEDVEREYVSMAFDKRKGAGTQYNIRRYIGGDKNLPIWREAESPDELMGEFLDVPTDLIRPYAKSLGFKRVGVPRGYVEGFNPAYDSYMQDLINFKLPNGIIHADTPNYNWHLTGVVDGKQVVPTPDQIIKGYDNFVDGKHEKFRKARLLGLYATPEDQVINRL